MRKFTKQHAENIKEAIRMWKTVPSENVVKDLNTWRSEPHACSSLDSPATCNTLACFGGWCAHWPKFQDQGVIIDRDGGPFMPHHLLVAGEVAGHLFGDYYLFHITGVHRYDTDTRRLSDHSVVMNRLTSLLKEAEAYLSLTSV